VALLCEVEFTPLCSPALLNKIGGLNEPADVLRAPLLHLDDFDDWTRWLALTNVEHPNTECGIIFSDMNLVFAAAIAGQGIAMGDELTCRTAMMVGQGPSLRQGHQVSAVVFSGDGARQDRTRRLDSLCGLAEGLPFTDEPHLQTRLCLTQSACHSRSWGEWNFS
jgi:DNA-binding transcriptional LysR family regulator